MKILNFFYENPPKFERSYERKIKIERPNIVLKGPRHCGKRTLLFNFLADFDAEAVLFLDLKDLRFEKESLDNLPYFLRQNSQIKILCLYNLDFIPNLQAIRVPILLSIEDRTLNFEDLEELELDFFDFEEFISVSRKNLPANHFLGLFLQTGRSAYGDNRALLRADFSALELEILKYLAHHLGKEVSINQIFTTLKQTLKTSKDSLYQAVKDLENRYIIHTLHHGEKRLFKIYFRDFALKNVLCIQKDFAHLFENMILCELFKLKKAFFYNKFFHFYGEGAAYISSPTLHKDLIKIKAKKILPKALELGIFHISFITLSNEGNFFERGVKFDILPFDKWALSF
ncbi:AAA family ATPase [Campylobacter sp.]|uniref:AAA family ATPase n=1 Tax=Campylobacter sp. TaxID=205 RepID=UPI0026DC2A8F|nr:AAA family ATPase [Campylobacter sp.]MDO4673541.1 ATP-binding protein [Campylobacter sp.]